MHQIILVVFIFQLLIGANSNNDRMANRRSLTADNANRIRNVQRDEPIDQHESAGIGDDLESLFESTERQMEQQLKPDGFFGRLWGSVLGDGEEPHHQSGEDVSSLINPLLELMRPWWKGDNVCYREEIQESNVTITTDDEDNQSSSSGGIDRFVSQLQSGLSTSCVDYGRVYRCTMKATRDGKSRTRTQIYECCHGYSRDFGRHGCPKKVELFDVKTTLNKLNATEFVNAMTDVGLGDYLTSTDNMTFFVPSNKALESMIESDKLNFVVLEMADKNKFVRDILRGHMTPGLHYSHEWHDEMSLPTVLADRTAIRINFYTYPRPFMTANCARISSTNQLALNAVVHLVDRVVMPAQQSLWEMLMQDSRFSIFVSLIGNDLRDRLISNNQAHHHTVLAFTNDAVDRLPTSIRQSILNKDKCYTDIISEHILPDVICTSAIYGDAAVVSNIADHYLNITQTQSSDGAIIQFHGATVISSDHIATNGVLQIIDNVILFDHMLNVDKVLESRNDRWFIDALSNVGVDLSVMQQATVFVPPEQLFRNLTDASSIINHVLASSVEIGMRDNANDTSMTLAGQRLNIDTSSCRSTSSFTSLFRLFGNDRTSIPPSAPIVNAHVGCARIIRPNVRACNGFVHYIDKPLSIPKDNILTLMRSRTDLSQFVQLIDNSSLIGPLTNGGNIKYTILAPTNEGLNKALNVDDRLTLQNDAEKRDQFIKRHLISDNLCEYQLRDGSDIFSMRRHANLEGDSLVAQMIGRNLAISGSRITQADLITTNGIVHILAKPIIRRRLSWSLFPDTSFVVDLFNNN